MKCWIVLLFLSGVALAEPSPQEVAVAFITAIDHGDAPAALAQIEYEPAQDSAAAAQVRSLIAMRRLAATLHDRYGQTADALAAHPLPTTQAYHDASLGASETRATLQTGVSSLAFRKIDGQWKIHLLEPGVATTQQLWLTNHLAVAMNECADEVIAGKYATLEDARHAMQLKLGAVVTKIMVNDSVTTRPTTMP